LHFFNDREAASGFSLSYLLIKTANLSQQLIALASRRFEIELQILRIELEGVYRFLGDT
jgi:hypothetical protein